MPVMKPSLSNCGVCSALVAHDKELCPRCQSIKDLEEASVNSPTKNLVPPPRYKIVADIIHHVEINSVVPHVHIMPHELGDMVYWKDIAHVFPES